MSSNVLWLHVAREIRASLIPDCCLVPRLSPTQRNRKWAWEHSSLMPSHPHPGGGHGWLSKRLGTQYTHWPLLFSAISPTYYHSVSFHLLKQNVTKATSELVLWWARYPGWSQDWDTCTAVQCFSKLESLLICSEPSPYLTMLQNILLVGLRRLCQHNFVLE